MTTLLIIIHVIVCLLLIGIVLLQHGKGADIGASFGGSSQSLFGSEGPVPLLNKITTFVAIFFMGTSITLAYISANKSTGSVMSELKVEAPATDTAAPQAPVSTEPVNVPMPATAEKGDSQETAAQAPVEAPVSTEPVTVPKPAAAEKDDSQEASAPQVMPVEEEKKQ